MQLDVILAAKLIKIKSNNNTKATIIKKKKERKRKQMQKLHSAAKQRSHIHKLFSFDSFLWLAGHLLSAQFQFILKLTKKKEKKRIVIVWLDYEPKSKRTNGWKQNKRKKKKKKKYR
jgi:hypothetical protein